MHCGVRFCSFSIQAGYPIRDAQGIVQVCQCWFGILWCSRNVTLWKCACGELLTEMWSSGTVALLKCGCGALDDCGAVAVDVNLGRVGLWSCGRHVSASVW